MKLFDRINLNWKFKGGGGGSSSGRVDYPDYMKGFHGQLLFGDYESDSASISAGNHIDELINAAIDNSPYASMTVSVFDPDTSTFPSIQKMDSAVSTLSAFVNSFNATSGSLIDDNIDAFSDKLDAQLTSDVYPRFEAGMRDINAVTSSAFAIGRANIEEGRNREVASHASNLRVEALKTEAELQKSLVQWALEANRIGVVAKKEEADKETELAHKDATWNFEIMQYGGNVLASIAGASTVGGGSSGPSTAQSAIGGALSGAASGAMIGSVSPDPITTGIGAAVGGVVGLAGGLM